MSSQKGFENIVRLLVENDAELDVKDNYGKMPIHFAGNLNFRDYQFSQLIYISSFAAHNGHFEIFKLLIQEYEKRDIDFINSTDIMGMSLLHFAAMNRNPNNAEMLRILLKKDIMINSIADDKTIPLHYACATGSRLNSIFV